MRSLQEGRAKVEFVCGFHFQRFEQERIVWGNRLRGWVHMPASQLVAPLRCCGVGVDESKPTAAKSVRTLET